MFGLTEAITSRIDKARFHTPSHAGKLPFDAALSDVTELPYTDNLLSPNSHIRQLENKIASVYSAEACFISTQGATGSIFQAIYAVKDHGAVLIIGKAHTSVYNALRTFNCMAYHVDEFSYEEMPSNVKTIFVTSPNYLGHTVSLSRLSSFAKANGLFLIVDSAHGSHYVFSDKLPVQASEYADMAIYSLHKTLPVMTGGSVLCVSNSCLVEKCFLARKLLHTTSPSFAIICSIENMIEDYAVNGYKYYDKVIDAVNLFVDEIKAPFYVENNDDKTRLVLCSPYDGKEVEKIIFEEGFVAECVIENKVVFIVNPNNYMYLDMLVKAVNGIGELTPYKSRAFPYKAHPKPTPIEFGGKPESIPICEAEGRKAYLEIGFYPPGVPLIYSHDLIEGKQIAYLTDKNNKEFVFGIENGRIYVVK